jgi:ligand-binding SRPBCC domain-containing protein
MTTIETTTIIRAPVERCFDLARSVEVHLAGNVHWGEQAVAAGGVTSGLLRLSDSVTWRARHFGIRFQLTSRITAFEPPGYFQDTMTRGPFGSMRHDHFFRAVSSETTEMRDVFSFSAPFPILGRLAEVLIMRRYMLGLLHERNEAIRRIAEVP